MVSVAIVPPMRLAHRKVWRDTSWALRARPECPRCGLVSGGSEGGKGVWDTLLRPRTFVRIFDGEVADKVPVIQV